MPTVTLTYVIDPETLQVLQHDDLQIVINIVAAEPPPSAGDGTLDLESAVNSGFNLMMGWI